MLPQVTCGDGRSSDGEVFLKRQYHHGDLKAALLQRGLEETRARGAESISLRGLAKSLGVSHVAVYRHFAHLDELIAGIAAEGFKLFIAALESVPQTGDARRDLVAAGAAYVSFALSDPFVFRLMFSGSRRWLPEQEHWPKHAFDILLTRVQALGEPVERTQLRALALWSTVHGLSDLLSSRMFDSQLTVELDPQVFVKQVLETVV